MKILVSNGYSLLSLCLFVILFTSCQERLQDEILIPEDPTTELDRPATAAEVEAVFANLVERPGFAVLRNGERFAHMRDFATTNDIPFNLDNAIASYEGAQSFADDVPDNPVLKAEFRRILALVEGNGFNDRLAQDLSAYKLNLDGRMAADGISDRDAELLVATADQIEFLALSPSFQIYAAKMEAQINSRTTDRKCIRLITTIAGLTAACATGNIFACIGLAWALWDLAEKCPDSGDPTDPCANSPNPCCGFPTCASGYVQDVNCNCVLDQNGTGCLITGCPPGYDCAQNVCIPQ